MGSQVDLLAYEDPLPDHECCRYYEHPMKTCRVCGEGGLSWGETEHGWRLHAHRGGAWVLHNCKKEFE